MQAAAADSTDKYSTVVLVRRLLIDEALGHWRLYAIALPMMLVVAGATALPAYLIGTMTNEAVVKYNFHGVVLIAVAFIGIFAAKGFATYASAVTLSRIGNRIVADNQRRLFDKLLQT